MATIGFRWEDDDAPPDKGEWERIIHDALKDPPGAGTVVLRRADEGWEVEAARIGESPMVDGLPVMPDPTDFQAEVEAALLAAGKPVRARASVSSA